MMHVRNTCPQRSKLKRFVLVIMALKRTKAAPIVLRDVVFGFIHKHEKNASINVPSIIKYLSLSYYLIEESVEMSDSVIRSEKYPFEEDAPFRGRLPLYLFDEGIYEYQWTLQVQEWSVMRVGIISVDCDKPEFIHSIRVSLVGNVKIRLTTKKDFFTFHISDGQISYETPPILLSEMRKHRSYVLQLSISHCSVPHFCISPCLPFYCRGILDCIRQSIDFPRFGFENTQDKIDLGKELIKLKGFTLQHL